MGSDLAVPGGLGLLLGEGKRSGVVLGRGGGSDPCLKGAVMPAVLGLEGSGRGMKKRGSTLSRPLQERNLWHAVFPALHCQVKLAEVSAWLTETPQEARFRQ